MPSLKSHLVALFLRHTRKKAFASPEALNAWIAKARKTQDHRPPIKVSARVDVTLRQIGGRIVYEVRPKAGNVLTVVGAIAGGPGGAALGAAANAVLQ